MVDGAKITKNATAAPEMIRRDDVIKLTLATNGLKIDRKNNCPNCLAPFLFVSGVVAE